MSEEQTPLFDAVLADSNVTQIPPSQLSVSNEDIMRALVLIDQKISWICQTLEWMVNIFKGLQAVSAMMPGKAGKMARDMQQHISGGNSGG